jgi:putative DNA primase/helicase
MQTQQFREAMQAHGLTPPDEIELGRFHRFPGEGKGNSNDAGWCRLFEDGVGGVYGDYSTGLSESWQAERGKPYTQAEREAFKLQIAEAQKQREAEEQVRHAEAATEAAAVWKAATPAPDDHPYLVRKGIKAHGAKLHNGRIVVPVRDGGKIHSLQFIGDDGGKLFLSGGKIKGGYFSLGMVKDADALCIVEGFATGASIHEATGYPVAVAFNAGNLEAVARALRAKLPDLPLLICADDDIDTAGNPGLTKATAASLAVAGLLAVPDFGKNRPEKATDFNDLAAHIGIKAVQRAIANASAPTEAECLADSENGTGSDSEGVAWPNPLPVPCSLLPVEPFDNNLLPLALRSWVADIAERMQCPPDFPAVGAMVALSSVIGRKACIRPKQNDDWKVVPNLWGAIVGRPGVMKSPALSEVMKPLDRLAIIANDLHAEAMLDHDIRTKLGELSGKDAEHKAAAAVKKGNHNEAEQLLRDAAEGESEQPPALRRYKVTDSTVEALQEILIENPWGTLTYRDELNGLLRSLDKPGQEGSRAFYLQSYDGNQGYTVDRLGRGRNRHIKAVCLSMLGGIQPGKIQAYIRDAVDGGAGDDGLLQRFGLLVWPDVAGEWCNVDRWPDTTAKGKAFAIFERLDAMAPGTDAETGEEAPVEFRFSNDAQPLFVEWQHELEASLRTGEHHPAMESHLSKYRKLVPAIALICALADGESEVNQDSLLKALAWSEYLQSHAARAYAAGSHPATEGATALLTKIKAGAVEDGFKPADVYLKGWSLLGTPDAVHSAAGMLCDLHHLQRNETAPGTKGGRPSVTYAINPKTMGRS